MHRTIKIRRVGRSLGAILPKELLQELNVGEGDELVVTTTDGGVKLSPGSGEFDRVLESFEKARKQYRNTLRKLAE
jgi:putative addiction module antidote